MVLSFLIPKILQTKQVKSLQMQHSKYDKINKQKESYYSNSFEMFTVPSLSSYLSQLSPINLNLYFLQYSLWDLL